MTSWTITPDDRDADGRIKLADDAPANVAPAVPPPAAVAPSTDRIAAFLPAQQKRAGAGATTQARPPLSRAQIALVIVCGLALAAALILLTGRLAPDAPAQSLAAPTVAPTIMPTATPFGMPLDAALVAYFDYRDLSTATALDHGTRVQPIARIGQGWVLLQLADRSSVWVRGRDMPAPSLEQLPDRATPTPLPPTDAPAPTIAPLVVPPAAPPAPPCDEAHAQYRSAQDVRPYGRVVGISCVNQVEADAHAAQLAAQLRATAEGGQP